MKSGVKKWVSVLLSVVMALAMSLAGKGFTKPAYAAGDIKAEFSLCYDQKGWSGWSPDNRRIYRSTLVPTALRVRLINQPSDLTGTVQYSVNVSGLGWTETFENGKACGNVGSTRALESAKVWLNGQAAELYDIYTMPMVDGVWGDWVMNGQEAGQSGVGKHLNGLRIAVVKKGEAPEELTGSAAATVDPSKPMVALTFDDGPNKNDARILAALEAVGGRATFFQIGKQVSAHPDILQRIIADGSELGNHSWDHPNMAKLSMAAIQQSIQQTNAAQDAVCGQHATVVRPPYGSISGNVKTALASMGYADILWDIDTLDWKTKNAANTVNVVLTQVKDGDIVLMHSIYSTSADAAEQIIPALTARGFQLVTVSEMANARSGMLPGRAYGKFRP